MSTDQLCRCEYVQRWLDVHEKYFSDPTKLEEPTVITRVVDNSCGYSQVKYYYSEPVQVGTRIVHLPYILKPPHLISPERPNKQ